MAKYYVYVMTSKNNTTLYVGLTNNIERRLIEHQEGLNFGFTRRYNLHKLVYFEELPGIFKAIKREKQLKWWRRAWKDDLIGSFNPEWLDLSGSIGQ